MLDEENWERFAPKFYNHKLRDLTMKGCSHVAPFESVEKARGLQGSFQDSAEDFLAPASLGVLGLGARLRSFTYRLNFLPLSAFVLFDLFRQPRSVKEETGDRYAPVVQFVVIDFILYNSTISESQRSKRSGQTFRKPGTEEAPCAASSTSHHRVLATSGHSTEAP